MATLGTAPFSQISPDNNVVTCEIFIAAPRERIFEALTDPKQAVRWWGQNDRYHLSEFIIDAKVGGKWSTAGGSIKMGDINVHGEFVEVDPPHPDVSPIRGFPVGCPGPPRYCGSWKLRRAERL